MQSTCLKTVTKNQFLQLVNTLNKDLEENYKFQVNYNTVIKYSLLNDCTIIPIDLRYTITNDEICMDIVQWINRRLYTESLEDLCKGELMSFKTRLVRLRIAINMAFKMITVLSDIEKEEWRQYMCEVYYKRFFVISQYYSISILELPF